MTIDPLVSWMYRPVVALTPCAAGGTWTNTLQAGEILDVVVPAGGSCSYNIVKTTDNTMIARGTTSASSTQTIGPYNVPAYVQILPQGPTLALNIARLNPL